MCVTVVMSGLFGVIGVKFARLNSVAVLIYGSCFSRNTLHHGSRVDSGCVWRAERIVASAVARIDQRWCCDARRGPEGKGEFAQEIGRVFLSSPAGVADERRRVVVFLPEEP